MSHTRAKKRRKKRQAAENYRIGIAHRCRTRLRAAQQMPEPTLAELTTHPILP